MFHELRLVAILQNRLIFGKFRHRNSFTLQHGDLYSGILAGTMFSSDPDPLCKNTNQLCKNQLISLAFSQNCGLAPWPRLFYLRAADRPSMAVSLLEAFSFFSDTRIVTVQCVILYMYACMWNQWYCSAFRQRLLLQCLNSRAGCPHHVVALLCMFVALSLGPTQKTIQTGPLCETWRCTEETCLLSWTKKSLCGYHRGQARVIRPCAYIHRCWVEDGRFLGWC